MSQYFLMNWSAENADAPFVCWNQWHDVLNICYCNNIIQVWFPFHFDTLPSVEVRDITATYEYDFDSELIRNSHRHNRIVGEYSPHAHSVIIFHKKHVFEIKLPPRVRKISCGENKLFLS